MAIFKNIELVIFDLDGTLYDLHINWQDLRVQIQNLLGSDIESIDSLFRLSDKTKKHEKSIECINDTEIEGYRTGHSLPGSKALVKMLKDQGIKVGIYTRNGSVLKEFIHIDYKIEPEDVITRDDTQNTKPSPEGINYLIQKHGTSPAKTLVIGDTYHDVEASEKAGTKCIIVHNSNLQFTPSGADRYVGSLQELVNDKKE